jgi:hypothetical protein
MGVWSHYNAPLHAIDGDSSTERFSTGKGMEGAFWYKLDLGSAVSIDGVSLDAGKSATDFSPEIEIQVSTDGTTWKSVACKAGATLTDVGFEPVTARYVQILQKGFNTSQWWSFEDLKVYCPTTDTCSPGAGGSGGQGGAGGESGGAGASGASAGGASGSSGVGGTAGESGAAGSSGTAGAAGSSGAAGASSTAGAGGQSGGGGSSSTDPFASCGEVVTLPR